MPTFRSRQTEGRKGRMKFYYEQPQGYDYGVDPNLELAKTVRLVPWSEELEAQLESIANAQDWSNPLMNLYPVYDRSRQCSWEFAEVASEKEARDLVLNEWALSWFEYRNNL